MQIDPPHPFRSVLKPLLISAAVLTLAMAVYFYLIQRPPVATGEVLHVDLYPTHTVISGGQGSTGMQGSNESYDQLLVLERVRLRNQTDIPLFLSDISESITLPDGSQQVSTAAGKEDVDRVIQAYPELAPMRADPIQPDLTLQPGQSVEGLEIFNFAISKETWNTLRSAAVVVSFVHQRNLSIPVPR